VSRGSLPLQVEQMNLKIIDASTKDPLMCQINLFMSGLGSHSPYAPTYDWVTRSLTATA
jgi:hypothetical protein